MERIRPIEAVRTSAVKLVVPTVARSGKEKTVAVARSEESAVYSVLGGPSMVGDLKQFLPLISCGQTPVAAPVGRGRIIIRLEDDQVVSKAVVTVFGVVAILGELVITAVTILVGTPIESGFRLGLAPSEIVTIAYRSRRSHVTGGPQRTARKSKVNILMTVHAIIVSSVIIRIVFWFTSHGEYRNCH